MANKKPPEEEERWSRSADERARATDFAKPKKPLGTQVGAWVLWIVGLALQCASVLYATDVLNVPGVELPWGVVVILGALLDVACVIWATRLWKKACRLSAQARGASGSAASKGSAVSIVMTSIAFVPMILFFLTAKNADKKTAGLGVLGALVVAAALVAASVLL